FVPPVAVLNDSTFLSTLDDRDWRSGISEAIKVALIKDLPFFEWIESHYEELVSRSAEVMTELIIKCADLHLQHIRSADPFDFGAARPVDFGHCAAQKLGYLTNFEIRDGEAVAMGIARDSVYSHRQGLISDADLQRILILFVKVGFEIVHECL